MTKPKAKLSAAPKSLNFGDADVVDHMAAVLQCSFPGFRWDDSVLRTAERFIGFLEEYKPSEEPDFNFTVFDGRGINQMVTMRDIRFSSICMHHLLPFEGRAHVSYLPHKLMVGASKLPRLVKWLARRPQTQERLTEQIADYLKKRLEAQGVAVVLEAKHTCMSCRGVREEDAIMITSEVRGTFLTAPAAREEHLKLAGL
jgi:GTP cyclohydrolase I